ncbi:MAG: hypothetical protein JO287_07535 [Pseudonocardiales bacterium]|nr:hypothetical protein [Pseudonocardiales bacterium]
MSETTAQGTAAGGEVPTQLKRVIGPKLLFFFVMSSGITSASSAAVAFAKTYLQQFITLPTSAVAIAFGMLLALINFPMVGFEDSVNMAEE